MFQRFYPEKYLDSTYIIDFEKEYDRGIRGVIFDVDNTLVPHGAPADERSIALFARLKQLGIGTLLLSNNKEPRVKSFSEAVGSLYIYKAGKPSVRSYQKAMDVLGTSADTTLFVGDQLFTDVWGANRTGDPFLSGKADPSERGDPDRVKTVFGKDRIVFL